MGTVEIMMIVGLVFFGLTLTCALSTLYKKCGPNEAMIVSGGSVKPVIIVGGGTIVVPLYQSMMTISLEVMSVELKNTSSFKAADETVFDFDGVIEVSVGSDITSIETAAQNFGTRDIRDIRSIIYDIAQDQIRVVISEKNKEQLADINSIRDQLMERIAPELRRYGLKHHGLRIRDIRAVKNLRANNTSSNLPLINPPKENGSIEGMIGIVTKRISRDSLGEVTYKIKSASQRITTKAKLKIAGSELTVGTPVIITSHDNNMAEVEPWTEVYLHYPKPVN